MPPEPHLIEYNTIFTAATGHPRPHDWQYRLADEPMCQSRLINIPTGLGKTAGVVLAWLYNRAILGRDDWPRRLVFCLPMRTLVEQTEREARHWIDRLAEAGHLPAESRTGRPRVVVLMGGEVPSGEAKDWDLFPEDHAIIIGTQDMLLSRALNRGYGMSRYRWPMHFALLNHDALWVMDEVQLMGSGLWTSAQLDWMREHRFKSRLPVKTWWMSATLGRDFLKTSDRQQEGMPIPDTFSLGEEEQKSLAVLQAQRPVRWLKITPLPTQKSKGKKGLKTATRETTPHDQLADHIWKNHREKTLSLVVCNRVAHAQAVCRALRRQRENQTAAIELLTSHFRPQDRKARLDAVREFEKARKANQPHPGMILVSTQVIEAGFDVSATRLWTQLAPWPSVLQRLGRLNRDGRSNDDAQAFVFEFPEDKKDPYASLPYEAEDLKNAREIVTELTKQCEHHPEAPMRTILGTLQSGSLGGKIRKALEPKAQPYPRAIDVHGLFSTEPDLFGGFTDISPWVRNADASADVTVFWRNFEEKGNAVNQGDGPAFQHDEGCPVAVYQFTAFLGATRHVYQWNSHANQWERIRKDDIRPGMTLLLPAKTGGYDINEGWTGRPGGDLGPVKVAGPFEAGDADDRETESGEWVTLETHLGDTEKEATAIADRLNLEPPLRHSLIRAAALHDIGKSLASWQNTLLETHEDCPPDRQHARWAKSPRPKNGKPFRPGFRHEAASALALWHRYYREGIRDEFPALAIYQVAAHHGKARTVLAARPAVQSPNVCGLPIPPADADGQHFAPLPFPEGWSMDFSAAEDGASGHFSEDGTTFIFEAPGWTGLVADLLGGWEKDAPARSNGAVPENEPAALGPFTLAYLETLLRAADGRASANPSQTEA